MSKSRFKEKLVPSADVDAYCPSFLQTILLLKVYTYRLKNCFLCMYLQAPSPVYSMRIVISRTTSPSLVGIRLLQLTGWLSGLIKLIGGKAVIQKNNIPLGKCRYSCKYHVSLTSGHEHNFAEHPPG